MSLAQQRADLSQLSGKTILITGGCGFIGSHFVEECFGRGMHVVVLDNLTTGRNVWAPSEPSQNTAREKVGEKPAGRPAERPVERSAEGSIEGSMEGPSISYVFGDITDDAAYQRLPQHVDLVVHLAAAISVAESMTNPEKYDRINRGGSANVYAYARRAGATAVLSATSAAIYGDCGRAAIKESFPYNGISPYAKSKYDMEELGRAQARACPGPDCGAGHTQFLNTRFFNVYGPRQDPTSPYTGVMSIFMARAREGRDLIVFGDGEQTRDFVFVKDVVHAALCLLASCLGSPAHSCGSKTFNIGTGSSITINQLAEAVIRTSGSSSQVQHAPARPGDILHSLSDVSAIRAEVGWQAQTTLEKGMQETWKWYASPGPAQDQQNGSTPSKSGLRLVDPAVCMPDISEGCLARNGPKH